MIAFKFFTAEDVAKIDKAFPEDARKARQDAAAYQIRMESMLERIKARKARKAVQRAEAMFEEMCRQLDSEEPAGDNPWMTALEKARASRAVFVQEVMGVFREDDEVRLGE